MFTVLADTRNSNLYLIAALGVMAVVLLTFAVLPAISAPQPVRVPVTGMSEVGSDYYQRHPELRVNAPVVADMTADFSLRHSEWTIAPVSVKSEAVDYFQRHPELSVPAAITVDIAGDFYLRHPDWAGNLQSAAIPVTGASEASDYFQRHPEPVLPLEINVNTTDYFTRHPELRLPAEPTDLSDYFLRH